MNTARFQISVRWMMAAVAVAAVAVTALSVTSGSRTTYLSCHLCHNRMRVDSRPVLGFPVSRHETTETRFPTATDHQHVWWTYARGSSGGLLQGSQVVFHSSVYFDGSTAPDGNR